MEIVEDVDIGFYALRDLIDEDELVGGVRACGLPRTYLDGGEGHEGLVAHGRGAEGRQSEADAALDDGV